MAASQPGLFHLQIMDADGSPAESHRLYTYTAATTTHKNAYTEATGSTPHTYTSDGIGGQFIALNARGELPAPLFLTTGTYDITLKTPAGATTWTYRAEGVAATLLADFAANGLTASPIIGGTATTSALVLRSTSGAGDTMPATTTDTIKFQRGNNGNQELGRFTPGGSFGVGDWADGTAVNQHAGDDGTTTRVVSVRAETAPLFLGVTDRDNSEGGGYVGRSMLSVEGIRLANATGSKSMGALRIITEGVSLTQIGGRVSILTRRDGYDDTDYAERLSVANDGNVLIAGGLGGVATANRGSYAYTSTVLTVSGKTARAVVELTTGATDADQTILGDVVYIGNLQTDNKSVALIQGVLAGSTATQRGGEFRFYLKADASTLAERVRFTAQWVGMSVPVGSLQAAPTLTITSNTIVPTAPVSFVGAGLVKTITVPTGFLGGTITILPTAAYTTDTTANIAIASTAVTGRAMTFTYDSGTAKWYPSY